ncbi:MAG: hypothetical protein HKO62_00020, partial [Gammaproteobacteria bacterium]|nr:hypothetical protein [Gammaproteobacteria bacterium]NNL99101.1 hypothetical protein [Gammaproteobacteria bacterium]
AGAWTGRYISSAARRRLGTRGHTAWYLVEGHDLSASTRLYAWLSRTGAAGGARDRTSATVTVVPASALVWHSGRSWVYRREADGAFVRIAVDTGAQTADGRLVSGALEAGDDIVTRGAQVLLSEEFRWSIPDEDED